MNLQDSNSIDDRDSISRSLEADRIAVPKSAAPDVAVLVIAVKHRQRYRRYVRGAGVVTGLGAIALCIVMLRNQPGLPAIEKHASGILTLETKVAENESHSNKPTTPMRVLARISQPQPVFQIDPETQQAWQIGWVETERSVPIDMDQFSPSQRQLFQTVLYHEDTLLSL